MLDLLSTSRRIHSPSSSALSLGRNEDTVNHIISQRSTILSGKGTNPGVFWFSDSRKHHSDTAFTKSTPLGKMPAWITMQGNEHQRRARSIPDFLSGGHYGYQHQVYQSAAEIFERLAIRKNVGESLVQYGNIKSDDPLSFPSQKVKRQAYELAYETLKYQELLEDILSDSGYFFSYPTADDTTALVVVMLFDFQNRKWTPRCQIIGDVISRDVVEVEQNLMGHRIRLAAALARCRVKNQSLSIDYVLPESVRQQEKCASALPQYAWVNTVKTSMNAVIEELIRNNYIEYLESSEMVVPPRGKFFHRDQHCEDVILFPSDQKEALKCLDIVEDNDLILQDKTSSLAAQAVAALLTEDDECDLIHSDVSSGYTTAHLAVLLHKVSKKRFEARELMYGNSVNHFGAPSNQEQQELHRPTVYACGVRNDAHRDKLNTLIKSMGLKNVKFLSDKFENIDGAKDPRFERVKAILVTPQCTRTAVANPVEFMLNEGDTESYAVLRDLSHGERHNRAAESGRAHVETIKTALKFPNIAACVYVTRSIHSVENEQAIQTAIKWHRDTSDGLQPFRICPPTLPLSSNDIKEGDYITPVAGNSRSRSSLLKQKYLKMRQSSEMNGCFIAVLSREIDPMDSMTVKDILRRAALKGLIAPTSPTTKPKQPKEEKAVVEKPATPPAETPTVKTEQQPVEKIKRHKSKVAFGKKVKPSSVTNVTKLKKTNSKSVDSNDVDKMLDQYRSTSKTKSLNEVGSKTSDMAQVSINLEFHNTSSLRFSETPPGSPKHDSTKISGPCMQSQINSDVETILTRLSSREASRM
uniref:putative methyltransferase NSUN7 isoform X2 n=1 Tax=Ciona intestinalis TaxID=7719 RepID=UPI0002B8E05A|nr:putative methyltransferase NSUN7 isoform X2 [Ciona intestinalis]|eukprot:XP_002132090.2 putative methyltransferase NSUN7 isoform X2 [Ciona intestinalis]